MSLRYSYVVFNDDDLQKSDVLTKDELDTYDYISLDNINKDTIDKYIKKYAEEVKENGYVPHWMFKDICFKETKSNNPNIVTYILYSISNPGDKIEDTRNLTISIYNYYKKQDVLKFDTSYRIKLQHIYQLYLNMRTTNDWINMDRINAPIDRTKINLFVYPVYMLFDDFDSYQRISNLYYNQYSDDIDGFYRRFDNLYNSVSIFISLNQFVYDNINNPPKGGYTIEGYKKKVKNIKRYFKSATSNKHIVIDLNNTKIAIKPHRNNIYTDLKCVVCRKLCDYRYQVTAHYHRYWCGSRKDGTRHLEYRWVEAYYKNEGKEYNIIKEYKE